MLCYYIHGFLKKGIFIYPQLLLKYKDMSWANQLLIPNQQAILKTHDSEDNPVKEFFSKGDPLARLICVWVCPQYRSIPILISYTDPPMLSGVRRWVLTSFCKRGNKHLLDVAWPTSSWPGRGSQALWFLLPSLAQERWAALRVPAAPDRSEDGGTNPLRAPGTQIFTIQASSCPAGEGRG